MESIRMFLVKTFYDYDTIAVECIKKGYIQDAVDAILMLDGKNHRYMRELRLCDMTTFIAIIKSLYNSYSVKQITMILYNLIHNGGLNFYNVNCYVRTTYIIKHPRGKDWTKHMNCDICNRCYSPDVAEHSDTCIIKWFAKIVFYNCNHWHYKYLPRSIMLTMKYIKNDHINNFPLNYKSTKINIKNRKYIMSLGVWSIPYRSETIQHMLNKIYI